MPELDTMTRYVYISAVRRGARSGCVGARVACWRLFRCRPHARTFAQSKFARLRHCSRSFSLVQPKRPRTREWWHGHSKKVDPAWVPPPHEQVDAACCAPHHVRRSCGRHHRCAGPPSRSMRRALLAYFCSAAQRTGEPNLARAGRTIFSSTPRHGGASCVTSTTHLSSCALYWPTSEGATESSRSPSDTLFFSTLCRVCAHHRRLHLGERGAQLRALLTGGDMAGGASSTHSPPPPRGCLRGHR